MMTAGTGLPPIGSFGKWAGAVFLDDRAILGIEFGPVAKLFVHDRLPVIDVLGAEHVPNFMDQGDYVEFGLSVRAAVLKHSSDGYYQVAAQPLVAVADSIDARATGRQVAAHTFRGECDDQIVAIRFSLTGEVFLQSVEHAGSGRNPFLVGPGSHRPGNQTNIEFALVVIRSRFNKCSCFVGPPWVSRAERDIRQRLDLDNPLRRVWAENGTRRYEGRAKD